MDVQTQLYEINQVVVQYETRMYAKMREMYQNTAFRITIIWIFYFQTW